jgi:hypothetical protein
MAGIVVMNGKGRLIERHDSSPRTARLIESNGKDRRDERHGSV